MNAPSALRRGQPPTRQRILDIAEQLVADKGVYGFTLAEITGPLGAQVPAIYKHYRSRDDVLVEVSRRYITLLASQFQIDTRLGPVEAMKAALDRLVECMVDHPAYVRLALVDFATPGGGMEYVKLAAGGSFKENIQHGPLAPMHARVGQLIAAGVRSGDFRRVEPTDFYRLVKAALLIRLVFPDDSLLTGPASAGSIRTVRRWLHDVADGFLKARPR